MEDAQDRGGRRGVVSFVFEVPGEGDRAGVRALRGEFSTQFDDALTDRRWDTKASCEA